MALKDTFNIIFSQDGSIYNPFTETQFEVDLGWPDRYSPDLQTANWVYNDFALKFQDLKLNWLRGWDTSLTYSPNSAVKTNNYGFYISRTTNTGSTPSDQSSDWVDHRALSGHQGEVKWFNLDNSSNDLLTKYLNNGWYVCDGSTSGVPDLMGHFFKGTTTRADIGVVAGNGSSVDPLDYITSDVITFNTTGAHSHSFSCGNQTLSTANLPSHRHFMYKSKTRNPSSTSRKTDTCGPPGGIFNFKLSVSTTGTYKTNSNGTINTSQKSTGAAHNHPSSGGGTSSNNHSHSSFSNQGGFSPISVDANSMAVIPLMYRPDL